MSGGIRQMGPGVWEVRIDAGRDPVTGRRRQKAKWVHGNKRDAQRVLNSLASEVDSGRFAGTSAVTFDQLATRWLSLAEENLSPTTLRTYKSLLSNWVLPALGDRKIGSIQSSDLDDLYRGLTKRAQLSASTVRQVHAIIRRAFRQAILWGWIAVNPATNATPPRQAKADLYPPNPNQVIELIHAASERDPEVGNFIHIAATTGARRGEICAIRWRNIDTKLKTLTIESAIVEVRGGIQEQDTKTHSHRRLALDDDTLKVFESQRLIAQDRAALIGVEVSQDAYVFSREPSGSIAWTPTSMTKQFVALRNSLGYDNMRLHDLRHFAATRLIAEGVPVRTVSGRLGHANPSTTLSVYSHFVEASDQDAAGIMGRIMAESKEMRAKNTAAKPKKSTGNRS
ncbi:MAG: tyrosine-type recombinase/integrase [Acidimicrobiales bacterium]